MMNLAEYRRRAQSLADFLPWAALVEKGVILNKDGSFQRSARFRGPDLDSATAAELVAITAPPQQRPAPLRLGLGDLRRGAARACATAIPKACFPTLLRGWSMPSGGPRFEEEGAHFESRYFLTLLWLPPADDAARAEAWLYENRAQWRRRLARGARRLHRPHRPRARADRRLHARGRLAR